MEALFLIGGILLGLLAAFFFVARLKSKNARLDEQLRANAGDLQQIQLRLEQGISENKILQAANLDLEKKVTQQSVLLEQERKQAEEKIGILRENGEQLKLEFQNLANRIFEEKTQKFTDQNKTNLEILLSPLRDQLGDFKKRVEDVYDKESKDRRDLFNEISNLKELNQTIGKEALNLTRALKGESKTRGNWGELILERILEESGLQNGRAYEPPVSLNDAEGRRLQPDVIVRLPGDKDVVIDSKVSLNAYEAYCSTEDDDLRNKALKDHITSVRNHIRDLSRKNYEDLSEIRSLDFVLMFIPIEAAFLTAVQHDSNIFSEAYKERIVVVSPSTLLVTLRTIQYIWRNEYQNKNAQEIARQAAGLYDQFVLFIEALDEIGRHLDKTSDAYTTARKRLTDGRGNLVGRIEKLKKLGISGKKEIPQDLIEDAADTD